MKKVIYKDNQVIEYQDHDVMSYAEPVDGVWAMAVTEAQWKRRESLLWVTDDGKLTDVKQEPKPSFSPPAPKIRFSVRDYIKRFTLDEQLNIRQAQLTDMEVGLVYDDFNRAEYIDVTDPGVAAGIDLYIEKGLLDPGRKTDLLAPDAAQP